MVFSRAPPERYVPLDVAAAPPTPPLVERLPDTTIGGVLNSLTAAVPVEALERPGEHRSGEVYFEGDAVWRTASFRLRTGPGRWSACSVQRLAVGQAAPHPDRVREGVRLADPGG